MAAAQYVDNPGYSAILFRRTYRDLALPGALMSRSHEWWDATDAHWDGINYTWRFPSGATIAFGYLEHEGDELRYQSAAFQYVGFDELTHFPEHQYTYLFSRLRRLKENDNIPIRMRSASNPGGRGHAWVRQRFNLPDGPPPGTNRAFVPSKLEDNPYLDTEEYERSFDELSELTRRQLREGDWSATMSGGKFDPKDFKIVPYSQVPDFAQVVRYWDLASSERTDSNPDPDWSAGVLLGQSRFGRETLHLPDWYILDIVHRRANPGGVEDMLRETALRDGRSIPIWIEQERGSSGKLLISNYREHVLTGFEVHGLWTTGSKEDRASIPAARAKDGRMYIVEGDYVRSFLDELSVFGIGGAHDDQVDALSGAMIALNKQQSITKVGTIRQI